MWVFYYKQFCGIFKLSHKSLSNGGVVVFHYKSYEAFLCSKKPIISVVGRMPTTEIIGPKKLSGAFSLPIKEGIKGLFMSNCCIKAMSRENAKMIG